MALSVVAVNAEVVVLKAKKTQSSVVDKAPTKPAKAEEQWRCYVSLLQKHTLGFSGYKHTAE